MEIHDLEEENDSDGHYEADVDSDNDCMDVEDLGIHLQGEQLASDSENDDEMEIGDHSLRQRILRIDDDSDVENNRYETDIHVDAIDEIGSNVDIEHFDDGG